MENKENRELIIQPQAPTVFNFFDSQQFDTMQRVSNLFANSELVPDMYKITKENPKEKAMANCMVAIEMAQRIGASPLMVMQNMIIIYGKPSWSSKFLIATVNTCGRFNPLKYRFTDRGALGKVSYTDYVWNPQSRKKEATVKEFDGTKVQNLECVAYTSLKNDNEILESSPVSIRLAVQEGWYTKNGSKWTTMTKQMLMYRAASFWTNAYAPELSMGMKTEEEVRDIVDVEYEDVSEKVEREKAGHANREAIGFEANTKASESESVPTPATQPAAGNAGNNPAPQAPQAPQPAAANTGNLFNTVKAPF
jgi:hypothetical protein